MARPAPGAEGLAVYPPTVAVMRLRPVATFANVMAASTASVPGLLENVCRNPAGAISTSSAARSAAGLLKNPNVCTRGPCVRG